MKEYISNLKASEEKDFQSFEYDIKFTPTNHQNYSKN